MKKQLSLELVELKHNVLVNKIGDIDETLRLLNRLIDCQNDINAINIIFAEYQKMYKAVLKSGDYEKYKEVEDITISKVSKIEAKLDKNLYKLARKYPEYLSEIENSNNFKNFGNLEEELSKIYVLKRLLANCSIYHSQEEQDRIKQTIYTIKFKLLIRTQIKKMVYENGCGESSLWMRYDDQEELEYYMKLLEQAINEKGLQKDEVIQQYSIEWIIRSNRLLNHIVYRLLEQDIEVNPQKYIKLLDSKIFNPHMCNIANDPYEEMILYAQKQEVPPVMSIKDMIEKRITIRDYKRKKANLSLLLALLKDAILTENMTIMECNNIYKRFGFECRPIVVTEGQEIVRRIFNKVKDTLEPQEKKKNETKGKYCKINLIGYNYDFNPKQEPFFTEAQIYQRFANVMWFEDLNEMQDILLKENPLQLGGMRQILDLRNPMLESTTKVRDNEWVRLPLGQMTQLTETEIPEVVWMVDTFTKKLINPKLFYNKNKPRLVMIPKYYWLWEEYEADFKEIGVRIGKPEYPEKDDVPVFDVNINLDDISDLPIDFNRVQLLTQEEIEGANKIEGNER